MKKIIFTLLTAAAISHAGMLAYMEASDIFDIYLYKCNVEIDNFNDTSTVIIEYIRDLK